MERSTEVEDLTRRIYDGMRRGDTDAVVGLISGQDGLVWIGTDPHEWWTGYDTVVEVFQAQLEATGGFEIVGQDPRGYREGDVGWVADQALLRMPDGTEVPIRLTAIAHREDGEWRFVQCHASIGVANQEVFGEELPT
ncbi:MAG: nuclear transport factor 2 family protein [Pseudonocardiaceae bacterium]